MQSRAILLLFGLIAAGLILVTLPYRGHVESAVRASLSKGNEFIASQGFFADQPLRDSGSVTKVDTPVAEPPADLAEADPSAWRDHLEVEHGPPSSLYHDDSSPATLGFTTIYVISAKEQAASRQRMDMIARALGLTFTYIEPVAPSDPVVPWIAERVAYVRKQKRMHIARELRIAPESLGGEGRDSIWLSPSVPLHNIMYPSRSAHIQTVSATASQSQPDVSQLKYPSLNDDRWDGIDWVTYLDDADAPTIADDPEIDVSQLLWDDRERDPNNQLSPATIAEWHTHYDIYKRMRANNDASALILTDNVDIEFDLPRLWPMIRRHLPERANRNETVWQAAFLGHCGSRERTSTFASIRINAQADLL